MNSKLDTHCLVCMKPLEGREKSPYKWKPEKGEEVNGWLHYDCAHPTTRKGQYDLIYAPIKNIKDIQGERSN